MLLNMSSKNGSQELVSLLQYMKETRIDNPNITSKDSRILELAKGQSAAQIADALEESEEYVDSILTLMKSHPDWTDKQILEHLD